MIERRSFQVEKLAILANVKIVAARSTSRK